MKRDFPKVGFVRLPQILQVLSISRSTFLNGVTTGKFPQPIRSLGVRITCWRAEDIHRLINDLTLADPVPREPDGVGARKKRAAAARRLEAGGAR